MQKIIRILAKSSTFAGVLRILAKYYTFTGDRFWEILRILAKYSTFTGVLRILAKSSTFTGVLRILAILRILALHPPPPPKKKKTKIPINLHLVCTVNLRLCVCVLLLAVPRNKARQYKLTRTHTHTHTHTHIHTHTHTKTILSYKRLFVTLWQLTNLGHPHTWYPVCTPTQTIYTQACRHPVPVGTVELAYKSCTLWHWHWKYLGQQCWHFDEGKVHLTRWKCQIDLM